MVVLVANIGYLFARKTRLALQQNLRRALGPGVEEGALKRISKECFRNLGRNYHDLARLSRYSLDKLGGRVEFIGIEHLEKAWGGGNGVVVTTAHLGNFDFVAQVNLARSYPITILVERFKPERLWRYWMGLRNSKGLSFQPIEGQGAKAAFRALRKGELVGIAADRAVHGEGIVVDFFGEPTLVPTGAAELALRTGCPILPAFCLRAGPDRYQVHLEPPIWASRNGGHHTAEDVRKLTEETVGVIERYIRFVPEQWMLFEPLSNGHRS